MGANNDKLWRSLCELVSRPDLLDDSRFTTIADRLANRRALIEELEKTFTTQPAEDWVEQLLGAGIPAGPIYDYAQALDNDHARHRKIVMEIDHPVEGKVRSIGFPVKLSGTPQQFRMPPPLLGAAHRGDSGRTRLGSRCNREASNWRSFCLMSDGEVHFAARDGIASIVFDRPETRNAMTFAMYDQLVATCARIAGDPKVRVATFRGSGEAFAAGTDIREFLSFTSAEDGIAYEKRIEDVVSAIEELPIPTIAVVDGPAMGGGLAIAIACDFRIATPAARFGVPIARTLGNCLSVANTARLVAEFGPARSKRLLLLADAISAEEALGCGFVVQIVQREAIEQFVTTMCLRLASHAPVSMRVAKESIRRLIGAIPEGEDLVRAAYGSDDFKIGVRAFLAKHQPEWTGR